jgi:hypothetical protein
MDQETTTGSGGAVSGAASPHTGRTVTRIAALMAAAVAILAVIAVVLVALLGGGSGSTRSKTSAAAGASNGSTNGSSNAGTGSGASSSAGSINGRSALVLAAAYLGMSPQQLRGEERLGHSLAQVASSTPGKSTAALVAAMAHPREERIASELSSGKITSTEAQARIAAERARVTATVNHVRRIGIATGTVPISAAYLGLALHQVREDQRAGRSLAEIADSTPGHSSAGLTAAVIVAETRRIESQAAAGTLTAAAKKQQLAELDLRVRKQVSATPPKSASAG